MTHFDDIASELFLVRVSAENNTLQIVVVAQRTQSRAAFTSLHAALSYIEQSLTQPAHSREEQPINGLEKLRLQVNQRRPTNHESSGRRCHD